VSLVGIYYCALLRFTSKRLSVCIYTFMFTFFHTLISTPFSRPLLTFTFLHRLFTVISTPLMRIVPSLRPIHTLLISTVLSTPINIDNSIDSSIDTGIDIRIDNGLMRSVRSLRLIHHTHPPYFRSSFYAADAYCAPANRSVHTHAVVVSNRLLCTR
jgi:hypothetical protein